MFVFLGGELCGTSSAASTVSTMATRQRKRSTRNRRAQINGAGAEVSGYELVGREINLKWVNGSRYDAVIVRYIKRDNEYKIVYPFDDGVEVASLANREWRLLPKRHTTPERDVLIGSIVEFVYPMDKQKYQAMIYGHSDNGDQLKICYLEDHSTDCIGGKGWEFVTPSPCALSMEEQEKLLHIHDDNLSPSESHSPAHHAGLSDDGHDDDHENLSPDGRRNTAIKTDAKKEVKKEVKNEVKTDFRVQRGRVSKRKPWLTK